MVINICYRGQRGGLGFYRGLHGPMPWKKLHDGNVLAEKKMHDGTIFMVLKIIISYNIIFHISYHVWSTYTDKKKSTYV